MKKMLNTLLIHIRGFVADFWMLPLALLFMFLHEYIAKALRLFPPMNPEKVGKIVPALIIFLLVMFLVRAYFWAQYPDVYRTSLMNKKNNAWTDLKPSRQFFYSRLERWVLLIVFGLILCSM
jgi:hypothetical protein